LKKTVPDLKAHLFAGDDYCDGEVFKGRDVFQRVVDIALPFLLENPSPDKPIGEREPKDVLLLREGKGRLYYRLNLNYSPATLNISPLNRGFLVRRNYTSAKSPDDVKLTDSIWIVKKGALVKIYLELETQFPVNLVALVDYMPAGFEALNTKLSGTVSEADKDLITLSENNTWYIHSNIRDDRVEVFSDKLGIGLFRYDYLARATTVGNYIVPPAKAEEMYTPDICGNSASELLSIV